MLLLISLIYLCYTDATITSNDALAYLDQFGYVPEVEPPLRTGPSSLVDYKAVLNNSLTRFQLIHGLNVTGVLDDPTIKKMKAPRCSLPDFRPEGKVAYFKAASKWRKKDLTYKILNENEELKSQTGRIMSEAFKYWDDVSGLTFKEVSRDSKADLSIKFGSRNHGDNYPFDGPGGVLAHAFFPEHGEIHFDEDEVFTDRKKDGLDLKIIATHEFGHALGLEHSLIQGAVMNPYYQGYDEKFKLGRDDIDGIQFLYGKSSGPVPPTTTPLTKTTAKTTTRISTKPISTTRSTTRSITITIPTTRTATPLTKTTVKTTTRISTKPISTTRSITTIKPTTRTSTTMRTTTAIRTSTTTKKFVPETTTKPLTTTPIDKLFSYLPCHVDKNAVFLGPDLSTVYASLDKDYGLFKFDLKTRTWKKDYIQNVYKNLPADARGGVVDDNRVVWFFHDLNVFAYKNGALMSGYPKRVNDFFYPKHPYAAAYRNKKFYVFKNWLSYELDIERLKVTNINRAGTIFRGIPLHVDSSFRYNGFYYFFTSDKYYKFDEKLGRVIDGYPKPVSQDWILCMADQKINNIPTSAVVNSLKKIVCNSPMKTIFISSDRSGLYVILKSGTSFRFDFKKRKWSYEDPSKSYKNWPVDSVGGVVDKKGYTWFFKDKMAYIYNVNELMYSIEMSSISSPDSVFYDDKKFYFIKGSKIFKSNDNKKFRVKKVYNIVDFFPGLNNKIDTLVDDNDYYYFFSGEKVYKVLKKNHKIENGYPKLVSQGWEPCSE